MTTIPEDPLKNGGIEKFAADFRDGKITSETATLAYLERISVLDKKLGAYQYVDAKKAIDSAKAMDLLIKSGVDLGPLMGVPIAVKDVFNIQAYPTPNAGTLIDLKPFVGEDEGPFIQALKHCGVVILGTTKAVEFCLGITGVSKPLGTPWNPYDANKQRIPGGSSSGSGVACAAGLCAFAIGSDSGGSVRVPAAYNGLFGLKTSFGRWPTKGAVPLDPSVDTIGLLTHTAKDAKIAFDTIERQLNGHEYQASNQEINPGSIVIGQPNNIFYDNLDAEIQSAIDAAQAKLAAAGCSFKPFEFTEAKARTEYFPMSMPIAVIAMIGKELFEASRKKMDPVVGNRVANGIDADAATFMQRQQNRQVNIENAKRYFASMDVIASPTTISVAPFVDEFEDDEVAMQYAMGMTQNTQPANYLNQCAVSIPLPRLQNQQQVGYQLIAAPMADTKLLDIALAIENLLGPTALPDLSQFQ